MGQYTEALKAFSEALSIQQALGNRWWEAIVWLEAGIIQMIVGKYIDGEAAFRTSQRFFREIGAEAGAAYAQVNLGQVLRDIGRYKEAAEALSGGLDFAIRQNDRHLMAICHSDLALLGLTSKMYSLVDTHAPMAREIFIEIGTPYSATVDLATLGMTALLRGDLKSAVEYTTSLFDLLNKCGGEGPDFPHRDYWMCAQVFSAAGHAIEAEIARIAARRLLLEKADKISDMQMRASFLENVSFNREISAKE